MNADNKQDEAQNTGAAQALPAAAGSPLRCGVEGCELVIRIGVTRLTGNDDHDEIPDLPITDPIRWAEEVKREIERDRGDGATPISLLLDQMILNAIDMGATGIDLKRLREIQANIEVSHRVRHERN